MKGIRAELAATVEGRHKEQRDKTRGQKLYKALEVHRFNMLESKMCRSSKESNHILLSRPV